MKIMHSYRKILMFVPLVVLAVMTTGCGYNVGNQSRPNVRSVCVSIFERGKEVYRRELEFQLTEAVIKRIEMETNYKVTTQARADTKLTASIDLISQRNTSFNPDTGQPREKEITMDVSFKWVDIRNGKTLAEEGAMSVSGIYIPAEPTNEDFFLGSRTVLNELAARIVEHMEAPWGEDDDFDDTAKKENQPSGGPTR